MGDKELDFGFIVEKTFGVIGERFVELILLALIFVIVPQIVLSFLISSMFDSAVASGSMMPTFSLGMMLGSIVAGLLPLLMQAAAVHTTVEALTGRPSDVGTSVGVAIAVFLPLLGLSILMGLGLAIGFMLLIIPGLILLTYWVVAVPSFIVEDTGIIGAFERSAELTKGQRWRIFGLIVLVWIAYAVVAYIITMLTGGAMASAAYAQNFTLMGAIVNGVLGALSAIVGSVGVAVLYVHLRDLQDGTSLDTISDVFR
ncbi:glycerophosphoryl diester phosphodiesterase membrane domain-containing protein [Henriciella sp. AS95]|uniref:glycerophosphoryl diester phosphodiesterase membrane domain-containing protein n=1 Tax=Henriciella sp. AS95 TaxID=3135782 RepID=UPI00317EB1B1